MPWGKGSESTVEKIKKVVRKYGEGATSRRLLLVVCSVVCALGLQVISSFLDGFLPSEWRGDARRVALEFGIPRWFVLNQFAFMLLNVVEWGILALVCLFWGVVAAGKARFFCIALSLFYPLTHVCLSAWGTVSLGLPINWYRLFANILPASLPAIPIGLISWWFGRFLNSKFTSFTSQGSQLLTNDKTEK